MASVERVHYYHADASTLGGSIEQPVSKIIPSQAEISLPSSGGATAKETVAFDFETIVSCTRAYSHATGSVSKKSGGWTTLVTSVVEGLNLLEVVTADRVVGQISIEHPRVGNIPKVTYVGSQFVNLRIGGVLVEPEINLKLLTPADYDPNTPWPENESFLTVVREQHRARISGKGVPEWIGERYGWIESKEAVNKGGFVLCSLVDRIPGKFPGKYGGHIVEIPEVGVFFFGEVIVDQGMFSLTMVRAELGCPVHGSVSAASARTNGHSYP